MTYLGQVLKIDERERYFKVIAAVETGYNTDVYTLRVPFDKMAPDLIEGHKILFTGHSKQRDGIKQFYLESLARRDFSSCLKCGLPLTSYMCFIKHDVEAQSFDGNWTIVHKVDSNGHVKLFFEQGHFVFAAVSTPQLWVHERFLDLEVGDTARLEGWRYRQKTSLKFIEKIDFSI